MFKEVIKFSAIHCDNKIFTFQFRKVELSHLLHLTLSVSQGCMLLNIENNLYTRENITYQDFKAIAPAVIGNV